MKQIGLVKKVSKVLRIDKDIPEGQLQIPKIGFAALVLFVFGKTQGLVDLANASRLTSSER
jgi:hypothetical protein